MGTIAIWTMASALAAGTAVGAGAANSGDETMTKHARGEFDVKMAPLASEEHADGNSTGRYALDKRYHGALDAAAKGEMLTGGTAVKGSAGYVAIERVEGTLDGRRGSFLLQHLGRMGRGTQELTITVVPDSGTGELAGLSGQLTIEIESGKHRYAFVYTLVTATP